VWNSDTFYFKAGVYLGVNESTGSGEGQASFYGLDFSHGAGGMGGWDEAPAEEPPVVVDTPDVPSDDIGFDFDNPPEPPDHDWYALFG
jgi:hypothetical protein